MREHFISVTRQCEASCAFCLSRRSEGEPRHLSVDRLAAELALAREKRALTLLGGGEPTLHPEFDGILDLLRDQTGRDFVLETNGWRLDTPESAGRLRGAGWRAIRLYAPHPEPDGYEAITKVPGSYERFLAALSELSRLPYPLVLSVPLLRANLDCLGSFVESSRFAGVDGLHLHLLDPLRSAPGTQQEAPSLAEVAAAVLPLLARARAAGLSVTFSHAWYLPPCAAPRLDREQPLLSPLPDAPDKHPLRPTHAAECAECQLAERCPGLPMLPEGWESGLTPRPLGREEALAAEFHLLQMRAESRQRSSADDRRNIERTRMWSGRKLLELAIVRLNFLCNMSCPFCFVNLDRSVFPWERLQAQIEELGRERLDLVIFSGGEPTLSPHLTEAIALARKVGIPQVEIQTNGLNIQSPEFARSLVAAGLTQVTLSLHGSRAEIANRNTNTPGGFERTVRALECLASTGVTIDLNFVLNALNREDAVSFVEFYHATVGNPFGGQRWPNVRLLLSVVRPNMYFEAEDRSPFCRYSELVEALVRAVRRCRELGISFSGMEGGCGLPPCLFLPYPDVLETVRGVQDFRVHQQEGSNTFAEQCSGCANRETCNGISRKYLLIYGTDEFQPLPGLSS